MKFSAREDIEAPLDHVFERVTDFASFERSAMRRGADVRQLDQGAGGPVGKTWRVIFQYRGRQRDVTARVTDFDAPTGYAITAQSGGMDILSSVELLALSPKRTRLSFAVDLKPTTLSARLLIQSMKLGKQNLVRRFKMRVADYAQELEDGYAGRG